MKAIFAASLVSLLASTALAKPKAPAAKPVEKAPVAKPVALADMPVEKAVAMPVEAPAEQAVAKPVSLADMPLEMLADTVVGSDRVAGKAADKVAPKAPAVDELTKLDLGNQFGLKKRQMAPLPTPDIDIEQFEAKSLSEKQVGAIVAERADDLEYCWLRLPQSKRVVSAAILHLEIEASGKVSAVEVNGDLPAGVGKCITQLAGRWTFPAADAASVIDHGIMLTTTSQKVR